MGERIKGIRNIRLIDGEKVITGRAVIFNDRIIRVQDINDDGAGIEWCDGGNLLLSAGFIDLHIHGCAGADAMDEESGALQLICRQLPGSGVTSYLPTTMTMVFDRVEKALQRIRKGMKEAGGARILGAHLEGPFINPSYKGAQDGSYILPLEYERIQAYNDVIRLVTVAPEREGYETFIQQAARAGMVVSIGHSGATYEQAMTAIESGADHITHIFNAQTGLNHRQPGVVGAALDTDVTCELIADNVHVHPAVQRMLHRLKGLDKMILITDAMRASMMGTGIYDLGGQRVTVENDQARLDSGVIAGSVLTLNQAVANYRATTGITLPEAVKLVTENPAKRIGEWERLGSIAAGKTADMVLFDEEMTVYRTFVAGQEVYRR